MRQARLASNGQYAAAGKKVRGNCQKFGIYASLCESPNGDYGRLPGCSTSMRSGTDARHLRKRYECIIVSSHLRP